MKKLLGEKMEIIFKDSNVVVVYKQAGELSEGESPESLPVIIRDRLAACGEKNTTVFVVHRLDRETSGLCVFARSAFAAAYLSAAIADGSMKKQYLAAVVGVPSEREGELVDYLFYDRSKSKTYVVKRERRGVKKASLYYRVIGEVDGNALLQIDLHTGRTHQIRAQFASRGHSVLGDRRYGAPPSDGKGIALLSYKLTFPHPKNAELMEFRADIPQDSVWGAFASLKHI